MLPEHCKPGRDLRPVNTLAGETVRGGCSTKDSEHPSWRAVRPKGLSLPVSLATGAIAYFAFASSQLAGLTGLSPLRLPQNWASDALLNRPNTLWFFGLRRTLQTTEIG